jgi:hypothetical protein
MDGQFDDASDEEITSIKNSTTIFKNKIIKPFTSSNNKSKNNNKITIKEEVELGFFTGHEGNELNKESWDDNDDDEDEFDVMETSLMREESSGSSAKMNSVGGAELGKKINLSTRVENDITRSEKKGEKRPNYYGKDDR